MTKNQYRIGRFHIITIITSLRIGGVNFKYCDDGLHVLNQDCMSDDAFKLINRHGRKIAEHIHYEQN